MKCPTCPDSTLSMTDRQGSGMTFVRTDWALYRATERMGAATAFRPC